MKTKMIYAFSMILFICAFSVKANATTSESKSVDVQYSSVLPTYLEQHTGIAVDFYNLTVDDPYASPCSEVCPVFCEQRFLNILFCTFAYCDDGGGAGTVRCLKATKDMNDAPADATNVIGGGN